MIGATTNDTLSGGVGADTTTTAGKPTKLHDAAQQFEALMIGEMMRSQRESDGDGWLGSSGDTGSESAMDIAEAQFSKALATRGGLGLAQMIERTMPSGPQTQAVSTESPQLSATHPK